MASHGLAWRNSVTKGSDAKPGFGSRHYSLELCVCLGEDPSIDEYSSTSLYLHMLGNPITLFALSGLASKPLKVKYSRQTKEV